MKTTEDIIRIVSVGGGVIVDSSKTTSDLIRIASVAGERRIIIRNAGTKTTEDLIRIASVAKNVLFDLS